MYVMDSDMESMRVGCFNITSCLITMFTNDVHNSKMKPQGMQIGSLTVPEVAENADANAEEVEYIEPVDDEYAALDKERITINNEGGEEF